MAVGLGLAGAAGVAPSAGGGGGGGGRIFTAAELEAFDGVRDRRVYIAFQGSVYDVSDRRDLYCAEEGGTYHMLAGKDATRALTKMSLKDEDLGRSDVADLLASELSELHVKAANDWAARFDASYAVVGRLVDTGVGAGGGGKVVTKVPTPIVAPSPSLPSMPSPLRAPGTPELVCEKPRIYRVRGFLAPAECRVLRRMATAPGGTIFAEAKIRDGLKVSDERWSAEERSLLRGVETRLGWLLGAPAHDDEVELVGTVTPPCAPGQPRCHLGLHVDTNGGREWRYATAVCYLSSVTEGGHTVFPLARPAAGAVGGLPPSDEEIELLEASQRLLDDGVDHTDRILVSGRWPERRDDAQALVEAASAGSGVSVPAEEGSVALFWTRRGDGSIDPHSWHGGEAVGAGCQKWTLQKFKEVPMEARASPELLASFVARTRRQIGCANS